MDLKSFLLAKGEWLLVAVAVLGVAAWLALALTDSASLPTADKADIAEQQQHILRAQGREAPTPRTREPANSVAALQTRLATDLSTPGVPQWLARHPSVFKEVPSEAFLYAYVALPTSIKVSDNTGSFRMTLTLPEAPVPTEAPAAMEDPRLRQGTAAQWRREVPGSQPVVNNMMPVAIEVQQRVGGAAWKSVSSLGDQGVLLLNNASQSLEVELRDIQSMQDYQFRARVLYQGSGRLPSDEATAVGRDIVVYQRTPTLPLNWANFARDWQRLAPLAEALDLVPASLPAGERVFVSSWSEEVGLIAKSDLRLALRSVSVDMQGKASARILMRKLLRSNDTALGWSMTEEFVVAEGAEVGETRVQTPPWSEGRKVPVDLRTGFELISIQREVPRVLYYEARVAKNENGQRQLELRPKEKATDVVVLRNRETKAEMRLVRVERMFLRPGDITYPQFPEGAFEERSTLEGDDPAAFQPPTLKPEEPIWHEPSDGALQLRDPLARTNQRWLEFKDGRYVYYDDVANNQLYVVPPPVAPPVEDGAVEGASPVPQPPQ